MGIRPLFWLAYMLTIWPMDRRLARHLVRRADSRALLSVGSRMLMSSAMMPMTTSSSTRVKPPRPTRREPAGADAVIQTSDFPDPQSQPKFLRWHAAVHLCPTIGRRPLGYRKLVYRKMAGVQRI